MRLLRKTGYVEGGPERELGEQEVLVARVLHHFMRCAFFNTHELCEVEKIGDGWADNNPRKVGKVTNPTLALINHSCNPNYLRVSHGNTTYGFARRSIAKGQEICDTYCKPYTDGGLGERQKYLEKYNFTCSCPACSQDWPTLHNMEREREGLPLYRYNCPRDQVKERMRRLATAEEGVRKEGRRGEAILPAVVRVVEAAHQLVRIPHHALAFWDIQLHQVADLASWCTLERGDRLFSLEWRIRVFSLVRKVRVSSSWHASPLS